MVDASPQSEIAVVLDVGSGQTKIGYSDEENPRAIFPSIVGVVRAHNSIQGAQEGTYFAGADAQKRRLALNIISPVDRGVVQDWEAFANLIEHGMNHENMGGIEFVRDRPVLFIEPPLCTRRQKERMLELFFEQLQAPKFYSSVGGELCLYATGRTTGLVMDSGDGITQIVPVLKGFRIEEHVQKLEIGGRDVTQWLAKLLTELGCEYWFYRDFDIVRQIKESRTYVVRDYDAQLQVNYGNEEVELPDGQKVNLTTQAFRSTEILFKPYLIGRNIPSLAEIVLESVAKLDPHAKSDLLTNIILAGGNTLFEGFVDRLSLELNAKQQGQFQTRIHAPPDRLLSAWFGGSLVCTLETFSNTWITRKKYEECGAEGILGANR